MANEKIRKVLFTMICVVLLCSMVLVAYAVWDDVSGKKTNDMSVDTGSNSVLTCTTPAIQTGTKLLAPDKTVNYGGTSTAANSTYYLHWTFTPTLKDAKGLKIKISALTVEFKKGTTVVSPADTKSTLSWWVQNITLQPSGGAAPNAGIVTKPDPTNVVYDSAVSDTNNYTNSLISGTQYHFVIKFTSAISDATALYKDYNINVNLSLEAVK